LTVKLKQRKYSFSVEVGQEGTQKLLEPAL